MGTRAPDYVKVLLKEFVELFHQLLGRKIVGIYLHGSLAMECFNPSSSDIDVLVVVNEKLNLDDKKDIGQIMLKLARKNQFNKLEMSIVALQILRNFTYPTPFELHFSNDYIKEYESGHIDFNIEKTDPDLAAHLMIIKTRGVCLFGKSINEVFPDISREYYTDSIVKDSNGSISNIMKGQDSGKCRVPVYGVLNLCRVLAYIEDDLITSKLEGGQWGIKHLPQKYRTIIREALKEYVKSGNAKEVNAVLLKQFAGFAKTKLRHTDPK